MELSRLRAQVAGLEMELEITKKAAAYRLMRESGIRARHKRRYKATTDSRHSLPVEANGLDRHFAADAPNRVWTGDITYIATAEGWLYLAVVIDLFNTAR